MAQFLRKLGCALLVVGVMLMAVGSVVKAGLDFVRGLRSANYNALPPSEAFARYLGRVPTGVSDLRAAGYSSIGGAQVWMRFRVEPNVLPTLTQGYEKLTPVEAKKKADSLREEDSSVTYPMAPSDLTEEHRTHWEGIRQIKAPEVYHKPEEHGGSDDYLVVDRDRLLVYFFHWNQ